MTAFNEETIPSSSSSEFKAFGLGILQAKILSFLEKNSSTQEVPKIMRNTSRWIALGRCSVHILPTVASIVLYWYDVRGYYIVSELAGLRGWSTDVMLQSYHSLLQQSQCAEALILQPITFPTALSPHTSRFWSRRQRPKLVASRLLAQSTAVSSTGFPQSERWFSTPARASSAI
jgi:hypothetical protein